MSEHDLRELIAEHDRDLDFHDERLSALSDVVAGLVAQPRPTEITRTFGGEWRYYPHEVDR